MQETTTVQTAAGQGSATDSPAAQQETVSPVSRPRPQMGPNGRPPQQEAIDMLEVATLLLENWWKLLICTLLGTLIMLGMTHFTYTPTYQATAKLYINNNKVNIGFSQVSINTSDIGASQALVNIYSEFIDSHLVLDTAGDDLAEKGISGYSYGNLRGRITARAAGGTQMLYLSSWDTDPERAIAITNTLIETLSELADSVIEGSSFTVIDPAYNATLMGSPLQKNLMMGAAGGFAAAAGLILLYYMVLNDQVKKQDWLQDSFPALPQLGTVPDTVASQHGRYGYYSNYQSDYAYAKEQTPEEKERQKQLRKSGAAGIGADLSFAGVEAYNTIRTNVKFSFPGQKDKGHVIGLTSAMSGDGKTYTSVNLAYAMAKDGAKVLLIDGDLRKLSLHTIFPDAPNEGLSEILCGERTSESVIASSGLHQNLSLLMSGSMPPNPSELLGSPMMKQLLEDLRGQFDYIILDLPPIGSVIDAAAVSGALDGMVLVVRHDHSRKKYIRSTLRQLELSKVRLLGFIYNANVERGPLYGRYYKKYSKYSKYGKYGYGYGYGYGGQQKHGGSETAEDKK